MTPHRSTIADTPHLPLAHRRAKKIEKALEKRGFAVDDSKSTPKKPAPIKKGPHYHAPPSSAAGMPFVAGGSAGLQLVNGHNIYQGARGGGGGSRRRHAHSWDAWQLLGAGRRRRRRELDGAQWFCDQHEPQRDNQVSTASRPSSPLPSYPAFVSELTLLPLARLRYQRPRSRPLPHKHHHLPAPTQLVGGRLRDGQGGAPPEHGRCPKPSTSTALSASCGTAAPRNAPPNRAEGSDEGPVAQRADSLIKKSSARSS